MKNTPNNPSSEDFWDLGDDELESGKFEETSAPPVQEEPPAEEVKPDEISNRVQEPTEENQVQEISEPTSPTEPAPPAEEEAPQTKARTKDPSSTSILEKVAIFLLMAALVSVAVWGAFAYVDNAPNGTLIEFKQDFPIEGEHITIDEVATGWREPVRDGDDPDNGVVVEARLIPCASIKVSGSGSTDLQVSFRDGEGRLIGDIVNLSVQGGKFQSTQSSVAVIHATAGFTNPTMINPYLNGDIDPWSLSIVEGQEGGEPIVKTRIEANPAP